MNSKRLLYVLVAFLMVIPSRGVAQESGAKISKTVEFYDGSAFDALKCAQSEGKLLLLEFHASWNRKSQWMHSILEGAGELCEDFVVVSVDTDTGEGAALAQQYSVTEYPFLVVFNAKGDAIDKVGHSMTREDFLAHIDDVLLSVNASSVWQLQTILRAASAEKLKEEDYHRVLQLTAAYLETQSRETLLSRSHQQLFLSGRLNFYGSDCFLFLRDNYKDYYDREAAEATLKDVIYSSLFMIFNSPSSYAELFGNIKKDTVSLALAPGAQQLCDLIDLREKGDVSSYVSMLEEAVAVLPEIYEYQLIMSLGFVLDYPAELDSRVKQRARRMVEQLLSLNLSPSKMSLTESLLDRF
ncbi:MAG: thioredoxin family protein [Rikenellaceae bacterium]